MTRRIITGLTLMGLLLAILFYGSETFFAGFTLLIIAAAAWEWTGLMHITTLAWRLIYIGFLLILLLASTLVSAYCLMLIATCWWLFAFLLMILYFFGKTIHSKLWLGIVGILVLIPCWTGINLLRITAAGPWLVLFFVMLISALDSGAYFAGTWWGKTQLAAKISPKKTIEGFIGGIFLATIISYIFMSVAPAYWHENLWIVFGSILLIAFFALLGDLFESMIKRIADVKDSSHILPGHGGILDRIDSYTAAVAPFVLLLMLMGYIR